MKKATTQIRPSMGIGPRVRLRTFSPRNQAITPTTAPTPAQIATVLVQPRCRLITSQATTSAAMTAAGMSSLGPTILRAINQLTKLRHVRDNCVMYLIHSRRLIHADPGST